MLNTTAESRIVEAPFATRAELADALLHDMVPGGLFVAGEHDLTSGQQVEVLVRLEGIEPGLLMAATVSWRRVGRGGREPPGTGVSFLQRDASRFRWLLAVAVSNHEAHWRRAPRFPTNVPVAFLPSGAVSVHAGTLSDVSEGGALLHAPRTPPLEQVLVFRLRDGASAPPVPARVVWARDETCGLEILAGRVDVQRFWDRVVTAARAGVEARLIPGLRRHS